jgi:small redox-active disulfide protein 2
MSLSIKVLGPGCSNCEKLHQRVREAAVQLGADATIQKVSDFSEYTRYGLLMTPGLVINEKLVSAGRVPAVSEIVSMLATALEQAGG